MVAFYNAKDQAIYDAGDKFVPQTKYLQSDYIPTEGISYEGDGSPVSYANSGIMTQAPIPAPLTYIPQNEGGGGGEGDDDDDENTTNAGITSKMDIAKNVLGFMMNPIAFGLTKAYQGYKNNQKQKADLAADQAYKAQQERDLKEMAANTTNRDGTTAAYNYAGRVSSGGRHDSTVSNEEAQANQDRGRGRYFFGGRVNYKVGGRTDAESQYGADSVGSYDSSQNKSGRQQSYGGARSNPPNFFVEDKTSIVDTSGLKSKSPEINIDYTDPRNYASLKGSIYNTNILNNDDINVDGTLSGEIGPVSYNTNFTDQGITNTNLTAGNFNADIDANKNYSLGYANNYNGIDYGAKYDNNGNLMFSAGVNFKNGGLAGLL